MKIALKLSQMPNGFYSLIFEISTSDHNKFNCKIINEQKKTIHNILHTFLYPGESVFLNFNLVTCEYSSTY